MILHNHNTYLVTPATYPPPGPSTNPFVYAFNQDVLNINMGPGTVSEMENVLVNRTDKVPALRKFTF